ncbi:elongin-C [Caerostris extrusa]|uniref:Elongin-C n=1 Tax=Caerostris extrusa TaxID=172846 RepID=A0AAV4MN94_CAEEX|nr:elongin-C [Caerostris extrusa]
MDEETKVIYGGCTGPDAEFIKLVSSDGHEICIKVKYTIVSKTIKEILQTRRILGRDQESVLKFENIPSHLLVKVCQYFTFKTYYTSKHFKSIPRFVIEENIMGDLLRVASLLHC